MTPLTPYRDTHADHVRSIGERLLEHAEELRRFREELHASELHRLRAEDETVIGRYIQRTGDA